MSGFFLRNGEGAGERAPAWPYRFDRDRLGNPIFWLTMEPGRGLQAYDTVGHRHMDFSNGLDEGDWSRDEHGNSNIDFTNTNGRLELPSLTIDGGPVTVTFWTNVATADRSGCFSLQTPDANRFLCTCPWDNNLLYWDYGAAPGNGRITYNYAAHLGKETQVTLVSAGIGGNWKAIYLNGKIVASDTVSDGRADTSLFVVGGTSYSTQNFFHKGTIRQFCIWPRVLTDAEVWALYDPRTRYDGIAGRSFIPTGVTAVVIEANLGLDGGHGLNSVGRLAAMGSTPISHAMGIVSDPQMALEAPVTLPVSHAIQLAGAVSVEGSVALATGLAQGQAGALAGLGSLTIAHGAGLTMDAEAALSGGVALPQGLGAALDARATYQALVLLGASQALGTAVGALFDEDLTLAIGLGLPAPSAEVVLGLISASLTLTAGHAIGAQATLDMLADLGLAQGLAVEQIAEAGFTDDVVLALAQGIGADISKMLDTNVTLALQLATAADAQKTTSGDVVLGHGLAQAGDAQLDAEGALVLDLGLALESSAGAQLLADLLLAGELKIATDGTLGLETLIPRRQRMRVAGVPSRHFETGRGRTKKEG